MRTFCLGDVLPTVLRTAGKSVNFPPKMELSDKEKNSFFRESPQFDIMKADRAAGGHGRFGG